MSDSFLFYCITTFVPPAILAPALVVFNGALSTFMSPTAGVNPNVTVTLEIWKLRLPGFLCLYLSEGCKLHLLSLQSRCDVAGNERSCAVVTISNVHKVVTAFGTRDVASW